MTLDQLLKLIDAGYTKTEIQAMEEFPPADETPADPAPEETPAPEAPAPAQPAPAQPAQNTALQDPILQAINKLTDSIMAHNINQTVAQPAEHSIEDALAAIIAPPKPKDK